MNTTEFIRRSAQAAGNAHVYSFEEMMEQRASQPYAVRLAKVGYGRSIRRLLMGTLRIESDAYELLSAGGQQIVYAAESKVAKIITHSLSFDRDEAETHARWYQDSFDAALPHVAEHMLETTFDTRRLRGGMFAALALQPRIRAAHEFIDVDDLVTYRDDDSYSAQLASLFDSLTNLYNETGLQLDLNGPRNIFLESEEEPSIKIVDTIVVSPNLQAVVDTSRGITTGQTLLEKMKVIENVVSRSPQAV